MGIMSRKSRTVSKGMARLIMGLVFIVCGFIVATEIPLLGIQTSSIGFNVYLSFAIAFITSGMVLAVEGAIENLAR